MGLYIISMLIFGTIGIFRRYIPISSALLACYRGLAGSAFLVLLVLLQGKKLRHGIGRRNLCRLVISGVLIGFNWILLFEAYNYTTVGVATLCYYMQPTIVILLAPIFLKERLTLKNGIIAAIDVVGMVFVSGMLESGLSGNGDLKGILFGLGAAYLYATVVLMNKKMPAMDAYEKTIIQLFSAAVVLIPYLFFTEDFTNIAFDGRMIVMLLIVGFVHTGVAYALYFGSMSRMKAQSVAILSYIDPISALILSLIILGEKMSVFGWIGAVMILGSAIIGELGIGKKKEKENA